MLYLALRLYLPSGDIKERFVVSVDDKGVVEWCPFEKESHSMLLVDELYIVRDDNGALKIKSSLF